MVRIRKLEHHGRETYVVYYGDNHVLKRPLPSFESDAQLRWLEKQHKTKDVIDEIHAVGNCVYNVPKMVHINDAEMQILEERAPGYHLTKDLYRTLSRRQRYDIRNSIANFLVDMNELRNAQKPIIHKISDELKFSRLESFIENKMENWFGKNEIKYLVKVKNEIKSFEYETREVWSHGDLNSGNVLYDPDSSKISFIDFAEAGYKFIYRDIFAPIQMELDICKPVYDIYNKIHDKSKFSMLGARNPQVAEIMKYRMMIVMFKRFIKSADDLRSNPQNEKSVINNLSKVEFMNALIQNLQNIERMFSK